MNFLYLNGNILPGTEATISVYDQGLLYGDGIFESFRSVGSCLYHLDQHYDRLVASSQALSYPAILPKNELETILEELRRRNNIDNAYFRITITRGRGDIGFQRPLHDTLTTLIMAREFKGFDERHYLEGIPLHLAQIRRNAPEAINPKIKSISNLNSLLGKLEAKKAGTFEVIMLNNKEHICEGSASNIFWSKDRWIFTPAPSTGLLEGVTRSTIIRLCEEELGLRVIAGEYKMQDLQFADEVFITSTSLEVMPVVRVEDFTIHRGEVGPIARALRQALHRDMAHHD
ncbi:MAG: branched-chain amino acid aminotransferase [Desulfuromonas sp.]|nr:MAG: branched-chain amino acid aminotransferase [Desulfuromonas sp.]